MTKKTIIACGSIKTELEYIKRVYDADVKLIFMPQDFHRTPQKMAAMLQHNIDKEAEKAQQIVLGYGLCSNGTAGLEAPETGLIIPRIHDCITMYLGSRERYKEAEKQYPGTYFLTKHWIDNEFDPLGLVNNEYTERVGYDMAVEAMETELKNYKHIAFINTPGIEAEKYRKIAHQNAEFFNKTFIELKGDDTYFKKILTGPYDPENFVILKHNETSNLKQFL
ncbi:MAG: DUF1638 domain-containing protein [Bacteroidota bacterium]